MSNEDTVPYFGDSSSRKPLSLEDGWLPGSKLLDDYVVEGLLGRGGMSAVYRVRRIDSSGRVFAVKTCSLPGSGDIQIQSLFLNEIRIWMEMPLHPNIAACYFPRFLPDRLAIFLEYVQGGTLNQWIAEEKLTHPADIYDAAIQIARGLKVAHDRGVVHQDIKPSNILMSPEGVAKIADFGLAQMLRGKPMFRNRAASEDAGELRSSGLTAAYGSPEQARGDPISLHTDIWSFGLVLLEMFMGGATWSFGFVAPQILETCRNTPPAPPFPPIPDGLADLLEKCFRINPEDRYPGMSPIIEELRRLYLAETGKAYDRPEPVSQNLRYSYPPPAIETRVTWDDPVYWLKRAAEATNTAPPFNISADHSQEESLKAKAVGDINTLLFAESIVADGVRSGHAGCRIVQANILFQKTLIMESIGDLPGAIGMMETCMFLVEQLTARLDDPGIRRLRTRVYPVHARLLERIDEYHGSEISTQKAILILESGDHQLPESERIVETARAYLKLAVVRYRLGRLKDALSQADRASGILQNKLHDCGDESSRRLAAGIRLTRAGILHAAGSLNKSIQEYNEILSEQDRDPGKSPFQDTPELASLYLNRAECLRDLGMPDDARRSYHQALAVLDRLVFSGGRRDLLHGYVNAGIHLIRFLAHSGDTSEAISSIDRFTPLVEDMLYQDGETAMEYDLIGIYTMSISLTVLSKNYEKAIETGSKLLRCCENRHRRRNDLESARDLLTATINMAELYNNTGNLPESFALCSKALHTFHIWQGPDELLNLPDRYTSRFETQEFIDGMKLKIRNQARTEWNRRLLR